MPMINRLSLSLTRAIPARRRWWDSSGLTAIVTILTALFLSKEMWLHNLLGFLLARAGVLGDVYPFGPAFFVACLVGNDRRKAVAAGVSVALGQATVLPGYKAAATAAAIAAALLAARSPAENGGGARWSRAIVAAAFLGVARLAPGWMWGMTHYEWFSAAIELGFVLTLAPLFYPLTSAAWFSGVKRFERGTLVALGLAVAVAGLGLIHVRWGPLLAFEAWNRWATLVAAWVGLGAGGAAMGVIVGVLASLTGWLPVGGMGLYGAAGLFAGLLAKKGKAGVAFGFLLGQLIVSVHAQGADEVMMGFVHTGVALGGLALVPRRWIARIAWAVPGSDAQDNLHLAKERRLREALNERLIEIGRLFSELADVFAGPRRALAKASDPQEGFGEIVDGLWRLQCRACSGFEACWERNFYNAYWETVDLVAAAERKGSADASDMPAGMIRRCHRHKDLLGALNRLLDNAGGASRRAGAEALDIVPQQLRGVAELVESIAGQVKVDTGRAEEAETEIREELALMRISVSDVRVAHAADMPELEIVYDGRCDGRGRCGAALVQAMARMFRGPYAATTQCLADGEGACRVYLEPEPFFRLDVEAVHLAKGGQEVSGDAFARIDLGGGKVVLALSDGMGVGRRAALQSRAAVATIEKMIRAGFDKRFAVQTANAALLLRSTEETFATVDVAVVDQFSGEVEILKVGSSPTFVKRRREVEVIRSDTFPIGILSEIEVVVHRRSLHGDDALVMMTDGILDALPNRHDKEEWIARLLRRHESQDPKALLKLLVERARQAAGGAMNDDVTLLVARLATNAESTALGGNPPEYARVGARR